MQPTRGKSAGARRQRGEAGVVLVEFAVALFPLLLIVLGIVDFGRALHYQIQQTHFSTEGARWAVVNTWPGCPPSAAGLCTTPSLQQYIFDQIKIAELKKEGAKVCITAGATAGDPVTVTVSAPFEWFGAGFFDLVGFLPSLDEVKSEATMRAEVLPTHYQTACYPNPPAT